MHACKYYMAASITKATMCLTEYIIVLGNYTIYF